MEIQQLRYFKRAAELESISKAAEELNIVQSAMSRSVLRLEEELGVKLFDRVGRGVTLNESGKVAYDRSVEVLEAIDRLRGDLAALSKKQTIRLSVEAGSALIPGILSVYKTLHPQVEFVLNQDNPTKGYDIRITSMPLEEVPVAGEIILVEKIKVLVPKSLEEQFQSEHLTKEDVRRFPFLGLKEDSRLRTLTDQVLKANGLAVHYILESDNPSMLRSVMDSEMGMVFYPERTWGAYDNERFVLRNIEGIDMKRRIVLECHSEHSNHFADFIRLRLRELKIDDVNEELEG